MPILPSGVTAAFGQSTAAMQAKIAGARGGRKSAKRRKARSAGSSGPKRTKRRSGKAKGGRLVKGSAAAKAWGRKMKRARRK